MRHAVAVFPFISGRPSHFGDDNGPAERAEVAAMLAELHRPASVAPRSVVRREPGIIARDSLEEALADLNHQWSGEPFSEPTRDWLARNAAELRAQVSEFDRLATRVAAAERGLVVTHGEPHPGNLIRTGSGLVLIDWDTVALALPERDLWLVTTGDDEAGTRYADATGRDIDSDALSLYRLDLGASAKAWAADRAAAKLAAALGCGVLVSLGGDIAVAGQLPAGGWRVRVQDVTARPVDPQSGPGVTVALYGGGLATSSTVSRRWQRGGDVLHHILDPRTGLPAAAVWRTVSVVARSALDANIASTVAVIRGYGARRWLGDRGVAARLVSEAGAVETLGGWPAEPAI